MKTITWSGVVANLLLGTASVSFEQVYESDNPIRNNYSLAGSQWLDVISRLV